MNVNNTKASHIVRYSSLDDLPPAPPLGEAVRAMSDTELMQRATEDPDAGILPQGFWAAAQIMEPQGTERISELGSSVSAQ